MIDKGIKYEDRTGFFLGGGGYDIGGGGNPANAPSSKSSPSNNNSGNSGSDNNPPGGNDDGPTARDLAMGAGGKQKTGTITDIEELSKATGTDFSGGAKTSPALEAARKANIALAQDLKNTTYADIQKTVPPYIPFASVINIADAFLGNFGFEKNRDFFQENVAGKYGYGYGLEDYQRYMKDRQSGKVGAYGNENMGQNALANKGPDDRQDVSGILENLLQPGIFPGEESPVGFEYIPYSNQIVIAPGSQGLASLVGGQGFLSSIL